MRGPSESAVSPYKNWKLQTLLSEPKVLLSVLIDQPLHSPSML